MLLAVPLRRAALARECQLLYYKHPGGTWVALSVQVVLLVLEAKSLDSQRPGRHRLFGDLPSDFFAIERCIMLAGQRNLVSAGEEHSIQSLKFKT